jgi:chemotaxis protein MotC
VTPRLALRAVVLAVGLVAASARAADPEPTIADAMSDLQLLQVKMAQGDKAAYAAQQERLHAIGAAIAVAKPETWKNKTETDAAVAYVLSGGEPRVIAHLLEHGVVPKPEDPLMRGALAYASGRAREAETLLGDFDAKKASLRVAGQLAFAQSVLKTSVDPKRAVALLDLARLLAPATLVEEAALRREILLVGDQHDGDRAAFLARQYVTRFGHSIYADNFIEGLATTTARFGLCDDIASLQKFVLLLALVTPDQRRGFLLTVSREQTLNGRFEVAGAAAQEALQDAGTDASAQARATLFEAAAQLSGPDYEAGVEALKSIDRSKLSKPDQELLAAVSFAAAHMRDPPSEAAFARAEHEGPPADSSTIAGSVDVASVAETIKQAEGLIARSAGLGRSVEAKR